MLLSRKLLTFTTAMIDLLLEWRITLNNSVFMMMIKNDYKIIFEEKVSKSSHLYFRYSDDGGKV